MILVVLAIILVLAFAFEGLAAAFGYPMQMPYYGGRYPFFFPFGLLFFFLFIFLVARLLFWPWGGGWRRGYWYHHGEAGEIVRQRYARGEITKEQYDQMMKDLEQRH
ncbi:MAG: SHOCT domain-containing protein [Thaumarchaeota archaeon]|nr:SHOCT domain-containing protein [Nitrososphaerota archaeon]